jgi:hypothetical protein
MDKEWGVSELFRRARFYRITAPRWRQLQIEHESWRIMALAIGPVPELA